MQNCLALQLLFTKLRPGPVTEQDIPCNIAFISIAESGQRSLYHALKSVYAPLMEPEGGSAHSEADSKLHSLVLQLEAGLGSSLRQHDQASGRMFDDIMLASLH